MAGCGGGGTITGERVNVTDGDGGCLTAVVVLEPASHGGRADGADGAG